MDGGIERSSSAVTASSKSSRDGINCAFCGAEAAWERNMGKKEKEMRTRSVFRYKLHDYEERERKRERDPKEKS